MSERIPTPFTDEGVALEWATRILRSPPEKPPDRRGWAHWWCPFHPDEERRGKTGKPNFGVDLRSDYGRWKCLRCGKHGGSLYALRKELGDDYTPPVSTQSKPQQARYDWKANLSVLADVLTISRTALRKNRKAWEYVTEKRGLTPRTIAIYGLGYGISRPRVKRPVFNEARNAGLVSKSNWWLWAGGIVYAEPPTAPKAIHVRHLRKEWIPGKYQTWGRQLVPYGSWRIKPETEVLITLEGLFDMLVAAQAIEQRGLYPRMVAVHTGGASPSHDMLRWYQQYGDRFRHVLMADPDDAGFDWVDVLTTTLQGVDVEDFYPVFPPYDKDPDEAILDGWWPLDELLP